MAVIGFWDGEARGLQSVGIYRKGATRKNPGTYRNRLAGAPLSSGGTTNDTEGSSGFQVWVWAMLFG